MVTLGGRKLGPSAGKPLPYRRRRSVGGHPGKAATVGEERQVTIKDLANHGPHARPRGGRHRGARQPLRRDADQG